MNFFYLLLRGQISQCFFEYCTLSLFNKRTSISTVQQTFVDRRKVVGEGGFAIDATDSAMVTITTADPEVARTAILGVTLVAAEAFETFERVQTEAVEAIQIESESGRKQTTEILEQIVESEKGDVERGNLVIAILVGLTIAGFVLTQIFGKN